MPGTSGQCLRNRNSAHCSLSSSGRSSPVHKEGPGYRGVVECNNDHNPSTFWTHAGHFAATPIKKCSLFPFPHGSRLALRLCFGFHNAAEACARFKLRPQDITASLPLSFQATMKTSLGLPEDKKPCARETTIPTDDTLN